MITMGRMKEIYMMYYQDNMSIPEIADELNLPAISVANVIHNLYYGDEEE